MHQKKMIVLLVVFFAGLTEFIFAQQITGVQTPCTTATQGTAGKFVISYTIGEMPLIQSWQSNGLLITQGVLQPFTVIADSVFECFSHTEVKVFPNPNAGLFTLQLNMRQKGTVVIQLVDATGKKIQTDDFDYLSFTQKKYDINRLADGTYFLVLSFTQQGQDKEKKCAYTIQKIK